MNGEEQTALRSLATAVASLISATRVPADTSSDSVRVIIPLMLVRDPLIEAPLHARYLADEFAKALARRSSPNRKYEERSPQCYSIDSTQSNYPEDFESSGLNLRELLIDYSADCQDRVQSIRNYWVISRYQGRIRYMETLRRKPLATGTP